MSILKTNLIQRFDSIYLYYGESCVERFEGMWSFAIYDKIKKLFLSRDRFAEKPFIILKVQMGFILLQK